MRRTLNRWFVPLLCLAVLLSATALFVPIIEPDGMLYATISRYMAESNDYLNIWADGHDWLDKPHLPFWISALSFELLGVNDFAYKLPAFLIYLLGLRYTFLLGRLLYSRPVAQLAVLVQATALHTVLAVLDVRAEPYLTTFCIAAVYYLWRLQNSAKWIRHLLLASLFTAAALMTKGLFAMLLICGGQGMYWLATRQWQRLKQARWYLYILFSFLFISPELYALYVQFDAHPGKWVFGRQGVSGIRFFFWDSQFGRFFKTGPITNGAGKGERLFFVHTTLWAFLPWSLLLFGAIGQWFYRRQFRVQPQQWVVYGGSLLMLLLFSLSRFQLPHYVVILFPFFALMTARFVEFCTANGKLKWPLWALRFSLVLLLVAGVALMQITKMPNGFLWMGYMIVLLVLALYMGRLHSLKALLILGFGFSAALYPMLTLGFYPFLLRYQSGASLARAISPNNAHLPIAMYGQNSYSLEFYAPQQRVARLGNAAALDSFLQTPGAMVYMPAKDTVQLLAMAAKPVLLSTAPHYHITKLKADFLRANTRENAVENMVLIQRKKP